MTHDASESQKLEELLQSFLNEITKQFEIYDLPTEDLDLYEKKVMNSESLLQVLDVMYRMFIDLMKAVSKRSLTKPQDRSLSTKPNNKDIFSDSEENMRDLKEESYLGLEKVLQKYEADIRNHIRIEQQLKIYTDSMQETMEEKDKLHDKQIKDKSKEIKELESKIDELGERIKVLKAENEMYKLSKSIPRKKTRQLKTSGSIKEHKLSNSLESVSISKKRRAEIAGNSHEKSYNKSKLSSTVDKRRNNIGNSSGQPVSFSKSFERKVFDTIKGGKVFDKSLMVNFKEFLKLQKTRDSMNLANFSNMFRVKKPSHSNTVAQDTSHHPPKRFNMGGPSIRTHRTNDSHNCQSLMQATYQGPPQVAHKAPIDIFNRRKTSDNSFLKSKQK